MNCLACFFCVKTGGFVSSCGWLRHRPGGMDLRSECPVVRAAVGMQECTQIGENGLSTQPPLACRTRPS